MGSVRPLEKLHASKVLFALLYFVYFTTSFFATSFFNDSLARKYSMLDVGFDGLRYLVTEVAPWQVTTLYLVSGAGLCLLALALRRVRIPIRPAPMLLALILVSAAILAHARVTRPFPTPVWDLALDLEEIYQYPPIRRPGRPVAQHSPELLDRASNRPVQLQTRFTRVLVFVMESITLRNFLDSRAALAPDAFFNRGARLYSNLITSNMDSRTGLLALLTSRLIPYEAYTDLGISKYRLISGKSSLVDLMRDNGYFTAFGSSQILSEPIVNRLAWDRQLVLTEADKAANKGRALCFNPYRFEDSCEDKLLLPQLYRLLEDKPKLFWVQQLVWGHTRDYSNATGKTDVQYYGELLEALVEHLRQMGLLEQTLIVVTSDHGSRDKIGEASISSYRIPLLFSAPSIGASENAALFSQIDFKDLLVAAMTGNDAGVASNDFTLFIGPTHSSIVGAVTRRGDLMVLKNRPWARYALQLANVEDERNYRPIKGDESPDEFLDLLEHYRTWFQSPGFR